MLTRRLERRTDAKARLALDRFRQPGLIGLERRERKIEHGHLHPARDVDADRVGNHRVVGGKDAADRQPVANVRVGHQRAGDRDRQLAGVLQLLDGVGLEAVTPDLVRRIALARLKGVLHT